MIASAPRRAAGSALAVLLVVAGGCGSSSGGDTRSTPAPSSTTKAAAAQPPTAKEAYAKRQAYALGRVDYASGEVTYLNPAQTGPAVLAQKVHSLSAATRRSATRISRLHPPAGAAALQRREVAQLRAYARRLDTWVAAHPKATVGDAAGIVHGARRDLDHTIDALAHQRLA